MLTVDRARAFYDRFGARQDGQGFYEDPALDDLIAHAGFGDAERVFEFGCGTGRLAERLLAGHLPPRAVWLGCDVSPVMTDLAARRLAAFGERARVWRSDGRIAFAVPDRTVDRVVSCYVLDLLSSEDIRAVLVEARRVLKRPGLLCLVSLTTGVTPLSRIVSSLWRIVFRARPELVGGCRPVRLEAFVDPACWQVRHRRVVTPFGVPSEVLVLESLPVATETAANDSSHAGDRRKLRSLPIVSDRPMSGTSSDGDARRRFDPLHER
ncbi:MAG: methyltransferase domain-containing protein [Betaproteobacteria bacterium]|nr:methyltransferase domain-containing protein [Betaproteobacteria bacterium]